MNPSRLCRKLCSACVLALALTGPAFAGWMPNGEGSSVRPPESGQTPKGEIQNPGAEVSVSLTEAALTALRTLGLLP